MQTIQSVPNPIIHPPTTLRTIPLTLHNPRTSILHYKTVRFTDEVESAASDAAVRMECGEIRVAQYDRASWVCAGL